MVRGILLLCFLASSWIAQAHQADLSTTMLVEQDNNQWVFQIRASLTAFQQEVRTHFAETPYKTPDEFKAFVIEHVKNNVTIAFNGEKNIVLKNPYVKLGHETNVVFEVVGVPETIETVMVKNSSFKDIHHNQSALVLLKKGFEQEQFILNDENQHVAELTVNQSSFKLKTNKKISSIVLSNTFLIIGIIVLIIGSLAFVWSKFLSENLSIKK